MYGLTTECELPRVAGAAPSDDALDSEICVLEKMLEARCAEIESLVESASRTRDEATREQDFQLQAFAERRDQALQQLTSGLEEPRNARVARLERSLEGLECSREFFRTPRSEDDDSLEEWAVLVR